MKNWLCILSLLLSTLCSAHEDEISWEDRWASGVAVCSDKNFAQAIIDFTDAINMLEAANNSDYPFVYVDRGKVSLLLNDYYAAITDFETALSSPALSIKDQVRALTGEAIAFSRMGMADQMLSKLDALKAADPQFPKVEILEHYVIIRNLPKSKGYRQALKCLLIHSNLCESVKDIVIYPSDTLIAVKKCHCGCECCDIRDAQVQHCDQCGLALQFGDSISTQQNTDDWTIAAMTWVTAEPKRLGAELGGLYAVDFIRQISQYCCYNDLLFDQYIGPFVYLANNPEMPNAPFWD